MFDPRALRLIVTVLPKSRFGTVGAGLLCVPLDGPLSSPMPIPLRDRAAATEINLWPREDVAILDHPLQATPAQRGQMSPTPIAGIALVAQLTLSWFIGHAPRAVIARRIVMALLRMFDSRVH